MRSESGSPVWFTAIAVGSRCKSERLESPDHGIRLVREWQASDEIRFFRETARLGLVRVPVRLETSAIPRLPPLPWHVIDPVRFGAECRLLRGAGFLVEIEPGGVERHGLALRIRRDGRPPVTLVTGARYPLEAPVAFDHRGHGVPIREAWSPGRFLVDVAKGVGWR
jgi:hypothetical protein